MLSRKERESRGKTVCVVAVAASNGCDCSGKEAGAGRGRAACEAEHERSCQWVAMERVHNRGPEVLLQGTQRGSAYNGVNLGAFVASVFAKTAASE